MPDRIFKIKNYSVSILNKRIEKLTKELENFSCKPGKRPYLKGTLGSGHNDNINMQILASAHYRKEALEQKLEFYIFIIAQKEIHFLEYYKGKTYIAKARVFK